MTKNFAVGQTWRTRNNKMATIKCLRGSWSSYPVSGIIGTDIHVYTWTKHGQYAAGCSREEDLIELIEPAQPAEQAVVPETAAKTSADYPTRWVTKHALEGMYWAKAFRPSDELSRMIDEWRDVMVSLDRAMQQHHEQRGTE